MTANDRQVGGEHYRHEGKRKNQHWDLMSALEAGYFPGVITKYVERHPNKKGREDLEKAVHYAEKYHEVETERKEMGARRLVRTDGGAQEEIVAEYVSDANLSGSQALIFHTALLRPDDTAYLLTLCRKYLKVCYPDQESEPNIGKHLRGSASELLRQETGGRTKVSEETSVQDTMERDFQLFDPGVRRVPHAVPMSEILAESSLSRDTD